MSGVRLAAAAGILVLALFAAASFFAPWFADRVAGVPLAPVLAGFAILAGALFVWFRRAQQTSARNAVGLAVSYAALVEAALYLWLGR